MISRRLLYLLVVILLLFFGSEFVVFSLAMPRSAHASLPLPVSQEKLAINLSYSVVTSRPLMRGIERSLAAAQRMTNEILSNIAERGVVATRKVRALVNATQEIAQRSWEGIEEIKTSVSLPTLDRTLLPPSWQRSIAAIDEALRSSLTASTNQLNSHDLVLESIQPRDSESKGLVLGVTSSSSATLITHAPSRLNFLLTSTGQLPRSIRNPFTLLRNAIANFSVTIPSRTLFVELPQPSRFAEGSKLRAEREPPNETPGSQTEPGRMAGPSPGPTPRTIIVSSEAPRETITVVREVQATTNLPQLTVTRDVLIGGGLTVQGNTVLTSALTVGNDALFQKSVTVNSNLTVEGTLSAGNLAFDTFTPERLRLTGKPSGGDLNQATLFIDVPSDTSGGAPLIGVAVGGSERLRFDAGGNLVVTGIIAGRNALSPNPASVPSIQPLIIPSTFDSLMVTSSFLSGGITALGDTTTDRILFTGRVATDILPLDNNQYDLGTASGASPKKFRTGNFGTSVVVNNGTDSSTFTHNTLTGSNTFTFSTAAGNLILQPVSSAYTQIGASGTPVLVADSNDLFIKDALETGGRTLITGNPAGTSVTQGSLVVNPAAPTANQIVFGVANNGTALFTVDAEGDVSVVGNLSSGGISARLDQIVAATTQAGAQDSNANTVEWNWDFTAAGVDSGLIISESTASTLGTQDQQALLEITTLSGSTAAPLQVTSTSADVGDIWFNLASAGDLEIRDAGTAFATFADSGAITFAPTGSSDTTFSLDSDTNLQYVLSGTSGAITYLTGSYTGAQTLAAAASLTGLSLDLSTNVTADAGGNAITGLLLTVPNGGAGTTYGIDIAGASDNGIRIGGATTDITTGTNEDLTLLANGSGVIVLNDSAKINSTNTLEFGAGVGGKEANAGKIGYQAFTADSLDIIGAGSASPNRKVTIFDKLTVNNGIAIGEGAGTTGARISPTSGNELIINRASGADTIWFGEAADSGVYTFRGTGGITISGATTDITTGTNEALTITANGTGDITLAGDTDTDVIFSGGTTDITTGTNEALTIVPNGSGDTVFNLDSDTNIQYALSGTSGAITYLTGSYGSGATLAAAASLTGLSLDLSTNVTADAGGNGITGLLLTIPNGGAGTTYGIDIQGASDNGVRIAGATTDITTGTNEALTITANGTGDITLAGDSDTDVIFSGGTTDITTGTNEALTIQPAGTGDTIFNIDADTNLQITATAAPTVDMVSLTNGSFGTTTNNVDALGINIATTSDGGADTNYGISVTIDNTAQDANDTIGGLTVIGAANTVSSTTQRYIDINAPSGNTNGTVVGVYIGSIGTPGAASEYGIRFGSGWDEDLVSTSGNLNISATSTGDIVFDTDADTDVRVTSSAGDTLLKVFRPNDITTSAFLRFDQDTAGGKEWDIGLFANDSGGDLYIQGYDDTAVQTRLVIDRPTGNVSIGGDTSPESLLDLEFATAGGLAFTIENGTTNLLGARYTAANFGLALNAGAFIDRNSTIQEEFYKVQNGGTADTSGVAGAGVGDGGGWGFYEGGGTPDCNIFNLGDVANGILRILSQTSADNGCLVMVDSAANNAQLILDADFLPVLLMKVSATVTGVNNVLFAGMADATDGANTDPANFIGFTNNGGSTWTGRTTSASTSTNVACTGNAISTVDGVYALLMVEVRSTTNVRFFVDPNTSDGISFSECGSGSSTNIPTAALAPELIYQVRTGGTDTTRLDVDFFRAWQDDTLAEGTASALDLRQVEMDLTGRSSIAQFFPADNPHLPEGNLVSLYDADGSVKVRLTEKAADPNMVGIVVRDPGLDIANNTFDGVRVAIGGRALVRVSAENGAVAIGDYLTSSSTPGVAIKATGKGMVIGKALSAFARSSELGALGLIPVFINLTYYDPASATVVQGSDAGGLFANLNASGLTTLERLVVTGPTVLQDTLIVYGTATFEKEVSVKGVLTVGTEAEPKGVTLYDTVTREPYCIMITQGEFAKHRGLCGTVEHQEEVDLPTPQATPTQVAVPPVISISDKEENAVEPPQAFPTTTPESTGEPESIPPPLDVEAASLN